MTDAPKRIWVEADYDHGWAYWRGEWFSEPPGTECEPYVRADLLEAQAALIVLARATIRNLSDTLELRLEEAVTYDECKADINSARAVLAKLDNA